MSWGDVLMAAEWWWIPVAFGVTFTVSYAVGRALEV